MNAVRGVQRIRLRHSPVTVEVANVTHGSDDMHVALHVKAGFLGTDLYLTTDEARQLAAGLTESAARYECRCPQAQITQ